MERSNFLKICEEVSRLPKSGLGIRKNVPEDCKVVFNENEYYPIGYKISYDDGEIIHTAILHDLKSNSIINCKLADVRYK